MSLAEAAAAVRWKDFVRAARQVEKKDRAALLTSLDARPGLGRTALFQVFLKHLSTQSPKTWADGLQALHDLTIQSPRDAALEAIAANPPLLEALQGAVGAKPDVPDFAAIKVLCIDGSPASIDALLPVVHHAVQSGGPTLDRLLQIERFVRKQRRVLPAPIEPVFALLHERAETRHEASGVVAVFTQLGLEARRCAFRLTLQSDEFGVELFANSEKAHDGFALYVTRPAAPQSRPIYAAHQVNVSNDERNLGPCSVAEFPQWLARAATAIPTQWRAESVSVEASKAQVRERIGAWALSGFHPGPKR